MRASYLKMAKPVVFFLIYLALTLLFGALLSYPLYQLIQEASPQGSYLSSMPFDKVSRRAIMLAALIGLWPFVRSMNLHSWAELGFLHPPREFFRQILSGVVIGLFMLVAMVFLLLLLRVRTMDLVAVVVLSDFIGLAAKALLAGLIIGTIEETFFRGALFGAIRRSFSPLVTVLITAVLYAAVHFLRSKVAIPGEQVTWLSGFIVVQYTFSSYTSMNMVDSFLALLAAGLFLGLIRHWTHSIGYCIGIHAGWVLTIKVTRDVSQLNIESDWSFLVGAYDGVIGYLGFVYLGIITFAYWYYMQTRQSSV